jgi:hypothetical protein
MDRLAILARLDAERRCLARDGEIVEILSDVIRFSSTDHSHHAIVFSSLTAQTADAAIRREIEYHRRLNAPFEWKLYAHDQPPDLLQRLVRHGLEPGPREAVMTIDLADAPHWIEEMACDVRRVDRLEQIEDFRRVAEQAFDKNYAFTTGQLADAIRGNSTDHQGYVAYINGQPASIGRLYTHRDSFFGGLYGGGTVPAFRRQGLYRAVVAARARDARKFGAKYLIVDALQTSEPILRQLGFEKISETWPCEARL